MKCILKFDLDFEKWVIDVELEDGEIVPVGKTIDRKIGLFEISKWDTKQEAEEWVVSKGLAFK